MKEILKTDREWLETNGVGGYASSTEGDCPTRKYHGMFVTPLQGEEGRFSLLSDARLTLVHDKGFTLGSSHYPGVIHPGGFKVLESFSPDPFPAWIYDNGAFRVKKEIFMIPGEAAVYAVWTLLSQQDMPGLPLPVRLQLYCNFRSSHNLAKENRSLFTGLSRDEQGFSCSPYWGLPSLTFQFSENVKRRGSFYWDKDIEYHREKRRGFEYREDRFVPGDIFFQLKEGTPFIMRASLTPLNETGVKALKRTYGEEYRRRKAITEKFSSSWDRLEEHSHHFMVTNSSGQLSIIAGYPWFGEWGRDTMIALPGLTYGRDLSRGAQVLVDYADHINRGLIPNTLGEMQGFTSHNSLDASLLYLRAADLLLKEGYGQKEEEINILQYKIFPGITEIISAFIEGGVPLAELTEEGLITAGTEKTQLTWMDAMVDGEPVTPRHGLAVDLNALWYEGLLLYRELCKMLKTPFPRKAQKILAKLPERFLNTFYLEKEGFLTDTVCHGTADRKLRPNMLFATAVSLLPKKEGKQVVERAKAELLTPLGMRTLAPGDPLFAPVYEGGGPERDRVYHQGTVWPWPLGIMVESALNYTDDEEKEKKYWKEYLNRLLDIHLDHQGIDSLSEVFDGLEPLEGKGCFAQAWSVGEVLRAWRLVNG